jgi:hypothetical protein
VTDQTILKAVRFLAGYGAARPATLGAEVYGGSACKHERNYARCGCGLAKALETRGLAAFGYIGGYSGRRLVALTPAGEAMAKAGDGRGKSAGPGGKSLEAEGKS